MRIEQEIRQAIDRLNKKEQYLLKQAAMWDVDTELTNIQTKISVLKWVLYGE